MRDLVANLYLWSRLVFSRWQFYITSSAVAALITLVERVFGFALPWWTAVVVFVVVFFIAASFLVWRDEHRTIASRQARLRLANDLAQLRHTAKKRYYDWWESCFDQDMRARPSDPAKAAEADRIRIEILTKLERELNLAEANYFNTPQMNEPFPPNRNLIQCPDGVLIKEFGYRIDRLGDIIQRLL